MDTVNWSNVAAQVTILAAVIGFLHWVLATQIRQAMLQSKLDTADTIKAALAEELREVAPRHVTDELRRDVDDLDKRVGELSGRVTRVEAKCAIRHPHDHVGA